MFTSIYAFFIYGFILGVVVLFGLAAWWLYKKLKNPTWLLKKAASLSSALDSSATAESELKKAVATLSSTTTDSSAS